MRKKHGFLFFLPAFAVLLLLTGCRSVELKPETVCGTWRHYGVDGRNGIEVPFDEGVYTVFLPDGTSWNEIRKPRMERYPGKWRIVDGEVEMSDDRGNTCRFQYDPASGKLSRTEYDKTFFPRGLTFVLIKEPESPAERVVTP